MSSETDYTFKRIATDAQAISGYASLLTEVFAGDEKFSTSYLQWQYVENPNGRVFGFDAFMKDELAAHYATIPVRYHFQGKELKGLLSLNTATHQNHRGKGLFTKLADRTYTHAAEEGYDFVIGVANQNSTHGFVKKLGFDLVGPLQVKVGMGKIHVDKSRHEFTSSWDEDSLSWRLKHPKANYHQSKNLVKTATQKKFISGIMTSKKGDSVSPSQLPRQSSLLNMWIGLAEYQKQKGLFFNLPDKLKPSPLNLIYKDLSGALPNLKQCSVAFELLDFDAY